MITGGELDRCHVAKPEMQALPIVQLPNKEVLGVVQIKAVPKIDFLSLQCFIETSHMGGVTGILFPGHVWRHAREL